MRVEADTINEYFAAAGEREPELREIDKLIREVAPNLKRVLFGGMSGKMIGYGMQAYQTKSMKEPGEWPLIALANQKNHMSLYLSCVEESGQYIAERHADRLGKVSVGRSCVRFKKLEDLNLDVVHEIIANIATRLKAGEKLFGI